MPENIKLQEISKNGALTLALDTISMKKQAIIFTNTKRGAEKTAEDIAKKIKEEDIKLNKLAEGVLKALSKPTKQCQRLAFCIRKGAAFHHSGLVAKQREIIEEAFKKGLINIIAATPTLCLSKDSKIWHGMKETEVNKYRTSNPLFALSKDRLVCMRAQKVQKTGNSSRLIEIHSVSGYKIKVTPNHRMYIKRNNKKFLVEAKEINKNDKIATIGKINIDKTRNPIFNDFVKENELPIKNRKLNKDEIYFIGVMLGDGYSGAETIKGKIKYKGSPDVTGVDKEIFSICKEVCKSLEISCRKRISANNVPHLILGKNKWFREFLVRCGVEKGENKHISDKLMSLSLKESASLLRGLFDTDGYVEKKVGPGFSNTSILLIKQIQKILLRFGIVSSIRKRKEGKMQIYEKSYKTKVHYELIIRHKKCIIDFYKNIGFGIKRKQEDLINKVAKIISNVNYVSCNKCNYKIYKDLFSGRSGTQKTWGKKKLEVIKLLGEKGELSSNEVKNKLGFEPRAKNRRLNHHYELIQKRRIKEFGNTEWFWRLNKIGQWIYDYILCDKDNIIPFFKERNCPLCKNELNWIIKKGWKDSDFYGDIFWDKIRNIKRVKNEDEVYDVVLPNKPDNDHLFVAEGFIVHNSAGVDLPAYRVIMKDLRRFGHRGMQYIPVLEYMQMTGRAGRPSYDKEGQAISVASTDTENEEIENRYINGKPEEILSKLAVEPVLRTYLLSLISANFLNTREDIIGFFSGTFWAYQFGDMDKLESIIDKMLDLLEDWGFIKTNKNEGFIDAEEYGKTKYRATIMGKRIAELYLDPLTANHIIKSTDRAIKREIEPFSLLQMVSHTLEMRPLLPARNKDMEMIEEAQLSYGHCLLDLEPSMFDFEYQEYSSSMKTALFFQDWIDETDEEILLEKYNIRPGEIKYKLDIADWLLYSSEEICRIKKQHEIISEIRKLRTRLKYGVKEELLTLLKLKKIGRVRARAMFRNKIKTIADLKKANFTTLSQILGRKIAEDVRKQVGVKESKKEDKKITSY